MQIWATISITMLMFLLRCALFAQVLPESHDFGRGWSFRFSGAEKDSVLELVDRRAEGPCYTVAASGSVIYLNNGGYLEIYDLSIPMSPRKISRLLINFIPAEMMFHRGFLYLRHYSGEISIINVQSPDKPVPVGTFHLATEPVFDWKIVDDYLYLAQGKGFLISKISDSGVPKIQFSHQNVFEDFVGAIDVVRDTLYLYSYENFYIIDMSDRENPSIISQISAPADVNSIVIKNHAAYLLSHSGIWCINISDPQMPVVVASRNLNCATSKVKGIISGYRLFVLCQGTSSHLFDISDPFALKAIPLGLPLSYDVATGDGILLLAQKQQCEIREMDRLTAANPLAEIKLRGRISSMVTAGDFLFLKNEDSLKAVYDIAEPQFPRKVRQAQNRLLRGKLKIDRDHAYQFVNDTLRVFQIDQSALLEPSGQIYLGHPVRDFQRFGDFLYASSYQFGLEIIDISDTQYPSVLASFPDLKFGKIHINGVYLLGENVTTLSIYSLVDPQQPHLEGTYHASGYIKDFCVNGNYVYLSIDDSGLWLLDISDPASPVSLNWFPGRYNHCTIIEEYLFTTPGLKMFDISNPRETELKTEYFFDDYWGHVNDIIAKDNYIFVEEENLGLFIFQNKLKSKQKEEHTIGFHYPNPFNSTITIRYELPNPRYVKIDIYNVQGHHVKSLVSEFEQSGEYFVTWDATNSQGMPVASGVYMYRIVADDIIESHKILLIR